MRSLSVSATSDVPFLLWLYRPHQRMAWNAVFCQASGAPKYPVCYVYVHIFITGIAPSRHHRWTAVRRTKLFAYSVYLSTATFRLPYVLCTVYGCSAYKWFVPSKRLCIVQAFSIGRPFGGVFCMVCTCCCCWRFALALDRHAANDGRKVESTQVQKKYIVK